MKACLRSTALGRTPKKRRVRSESTTSTTTSSALCSTYRGYLDSLGVVQIIIHGERIEGASSIVGGTPFIFISPRFSPRMLFTLGHELGHLIVHQDSDFAAADEDAGEQAQAKGSQDPREEKYCQWFASSLLLPPAGVGVALKRFRQRNAIESESIGDVELLFLAHFYGISFFAAANRCEELDLLPKGGALSLYQRILKDYKNPEERALEVGFPAREKLDFPRCSASDRWKDR